MTPFSARAASFLAILLLLFFAGCSRVAVEWTASENEIRGVASGPPGAAFIVFAGAPNGPNAVRSKPSIWSTVGPGLQQTTPAAIVGRTLFDSNGAAKITIPRGSIPAGGALIQGVAHPEGKPLSPIAVSDCMSVSRNDGRLSIRPHVVSVLLSPIWWRIGIVAAIVAACIFLRRVRFPGVGVRRRVSRVVGLLVAFGFGATLLVVCGRRLLGSIDDAARSLFQRPVRATPADPVDRVSTEGLSDLVANADLKAQPGEPINLVSRTPAPEPEGDLCQAAWMLWPRPVRLVRLADQPTIGPGVYLVFGEAPPAPGATLLHRNRAGSLFAVPGAESR